MSWCNSCGKTCPLKNKEKIIKLNAINSIFDEKNNLSEAWKLALENSWIKSCANCISKILTK